MGELGIGLRNIVRWIYLITILPIVALPSGVLFGINIKIISFVILICTFLVTFFLTKTKVNFNFIKIISTALLFVVVYTIYGFFNFGFVAFQEAKLIILTIILIFVVYTFHQSFFPIKFFLEVYSIAILISLVIKVMAYVYGYWNGNLPYLSELASKEFYSNYFNSRIVTTWIKPFYLYRINVQTDLLATFFPFLLLWSNKKGIVLKYSGIILILSGIVVATSLSRYLTVVFLFGLFLFFKNRRLIFKIMKYTIPLVIILMFWKADMIISTIEYRLFSKANSFSDEIRSIQTSKLIDLFMENPVFGKGIGAYDPSYIRSSLFPFNYEKQILSFFSKIGVLGMSLITAGVLWVCQKFVNQNNEVGVFSVFLFGLAGWFNPLLYSSNVILIYVFILLMYSFNSNEILKSKFNER